MKILDPAMDIIYADMCLLIGLATILFHNYRYAFMHKSINGHTIISYILIIEVDI